MTAFRYFHRKILYGSCPQCGQPTAIGFTGETNLPPPTTCTACRAALIARALLETAEQGPCARCHKTCARYGDHGSPLCQNCRPLPANRGDGTK